MSYGGQLISLDDLNQNSYIGIGFPYNAVGIFKQTFNTIESTRANLLNFFLTNKGDRYMNINFGAGFRDRIFELMTPGLDEELREIIINGIADHFTDVIIDRLDVVTQEDINTVNIKMSFSLRSTGDSSEIDLSIANNNLAVNEFINNTNRQPGDAIPGIRQSYS